MLRGRRIKKHILECVLDGTLVIRNDFSDEIRDRWECIIHLKEMIESNSLVFRLRKNEFVGSSIIANYVLSDDIHLFFVNEGFPVSVFTARADKLKNLQRCLRLTTLKIERETVETGEIETLYISKSFRQ